MRPDVETEFKLRATGPLEVAAIDAAVREAGHACDDATTRHHVDVYYDDARGSLREAGVGLRLRHAAGTRRLTGKTRGRRDGSLFVRDEWEAPWTPTTAPRTAAELPPPLRDRIEPFTLDRPLQPVLELATQRDRRLLQADGRQLCELAIDRVQATAAGRTVAFVEVELEVLDDLPSCERLADALSQRLPLQAADDDKPGHAAALLGLQRAATPTADVGPATPVGTAIAAIAGRHLAALQQAEVGVRRDDGEVPLHEMRVAGRRLREFVRTFRDLWPKAERKWLLAHLAETGRRLGELRDLDVMLGTLPAAIDRLPAALRGPGADVLAWMRTRRLAVREQVHDWLGSAARLADQRRLLETCAAVGCGKAAAATPLAEALAPRLAKVTRKVQKQVGALASDLPFAPLHQLRITCKRLRYLAEEFSDLPDHGYRKSLVVVRRTQQALGTVCDLEVAARRLLDWIPEIAACGGDRLQVAATLGGLAAGMQANGEKARQRATRELARLDRRKVYRRFQRASTGSGRI